MLARRDTSRETGPADTLRYVGRVGPAVGWSIGRHVHADHHELVIVAAGRLEVARNGRRAVAVSGEALFYARGEPHEERAVGRVPLELLFVGWAGRTPHGWPEKAPDRAGRISTTLRWMQELSAMTEAAGRSLLAPLLSAVLHEYGQASRPAGTDAAAKAIRWANERLAQRITLDDLADVAGMSRFHFAHSFKEATGETPMRMVRRARVEAARRLLLATPLPLRAIAPLVGFADASELSRVFRRETGSPPGALRVRRLRGTA